VLESTIGDIGKEKGIEKGGHFEGSKKMDKRQSGCVLDDFMSRFLAACFLNCERSNIDSSVLLFVEEKHSLWHFCRILVWSLVAMPKCERFGALQSCRDRGSSQFLVKNSNDSMTWAKAVPVDKFLGENLQTNQNHE